MPAATSHTVRAVRARTVERPFGALLGERAGVRLPELDYVAEAILEDQARTDVEGRLPARHS
jgi:hypothetical protein